MKSKRSIRRRVARLSKVERPPAGNPDHKSIPPAGFCAYPQPMAPPPEGASAPLTAILQQLAAGQPDAGDDLPALVYQQLRTLARHRLQSDTSSTLQPTELVHEAWLQLGGGKDQAPAWENRRHFFGAAARAMQQILVGHARRKGALKRGGGRPPLELGSILDLAADPVPETILALDEALDALRTSFPEEAEVVMLRFFAGLSVTETAAALQTSPRQVERHWQFARAWLFDAITHPS